MQIKKVFKILIELRRQFIIGIVFLHSIPNIIDKQFPLHKKCNCIFYDWDFYSILEIYQIILQQMLLFLFVVWTMGFNGFSTNVLFHSCKNKFQFFKAIYFPLQLIIGSGYWYCFSYNSLSYCILSLLGEFEYFPWTYFYRCSSHFSTVFLLKSFNAF